MGSLANKYNETIKKTEISAIITRKHQLMPTEPKGAIYRLRIHDGWRQSWESISSEGFQQEKELVVYYSHIN